MLVILKFVQGVHFHDSIKGTFGPESSDTNMGFELFELRNKTFTRCRNLRSKPTRTMTEPSSHISLTQISAIIYFVLIISKTFN